MSFLLEAELRCTGQIDGPLRLSVPPSVVATVVVGGAGLCSVPVLSSFGHTRDGGLLGLPLMF